MLITVGRSFIKILNRMGPRWLPWGTPEVTLRVSDEASLQSSDANVLDYSKGSKNFWSFVKTVKNAETSSIPHLIKYGQTFRHSVEKANILAEIFSKNSWLPASDLPLHFTPRPHWLCPKSTNKQGKLKHCVKSSISKSLPEHMISPLVF